MVKSNVLNVIFEQKPHFELTVWHFLYVKLGAVRFNRYRFLKPI